MSIEKFFSRRKGGRLIAIWIKDHRSEETEFFTPTGAEQQVGILKFNAGHEVKPHRHQPTTRYIENTSEVLLICRGRLAFTLYDDHGRHLCSDIASAGDILCLYRGGHGFKMLDDCEIIEVKQGPYSREHDKTPIVPFGEGIPETSNGSV